MPGGKTHLLINLGLFPWIFQQAYSNLSLPQAILFGAGYLFAALFMTPDLDDALSLPATNFEHIGHIPGVLWEAYWEEYAVLMPHRGFSHLPVLGTLGRWLYLLVPYAYLLSDKRCKRKRNWLWKLAALVIPASLWAALYAWGAPLEFLALTFAGCAVSDGLHILSDRVVSAVKKVSHI